MQGTVDSGLSCRYDPSYEKEVAVDTNHAPNFGQIGTSVYLTLPSDLLSSHVASGMFPILDGSALHPDSV